MAKVATKTVEAKAEKVTKPAPAKVEKPAKPDALKFGIKELAEELEKEQAVIRVALRKLEVEKNGGRYGWNTQKEFDVVVKQLTTELSKPKAEKAAANDKKTAKKAA